MSSRALRRLREEKEAALAAEEESDEESSEEEEDGGGGGGGFMMMLEEESSEDESSSSSESEDEEDDGNDGAGDGDAIKATAAPIKSKKGKHQPSKSKAAAEAEEEDLDAILSDMNIQSTEHSAVASDGAAAPNTTQTSTIRSLLLSKPNGFDVQDLDLDHAMRSLLGGGAAAAAGIGGDAIAGEDFMNQQPQARQRGRPGQNQRGRRTLAKKYLFGKPKQEWGKPPSFVGGGLGTKELTKEVLEEERHSWVVPWPYSLGSSEDDVTDKGGGENGVEGGNKDDGSGIPMIPKKDQRWFTLQMSDTYQEHNYVYQEMLSSRTSSRQQGALHDPNSLAMFVADHPYFAETILQLAMVLYYINDRGKGSDLLRRCMFLYEAALPSNVLPNNDGTNNSSNSQSSEILMDIDRTPNSGLFAALFRIMQTSGMSGCHDNALATGRFLLSLDPLRDPMGVLLILDYYALASRRSSSSTSSSTAFLTGGAVEEVEAGAAFIVQLVQSKFVKVHYKDPLTDRHHWCELVDMPNWAYSYALALYRLSLQIDDNDDNDDVDDLDDGKTYAERAEDALVQALTRYPMVLPKLLAMNKVNTRDRSFRMDWPTILSYFSADENDASSSAQGSVEDRVTRASGEHLVRIFVQRCHKLWKEEDVVQWLYRCAERAVQEHKDKHAKGDEAKKDDNVADDEQTSTGAEAQENATASTSTPDNSTLPPMISTFSPALARYAQCDPSEYEDAFRTFPPEAIALDPNIVAPAMALGPNGARRRFLRRGQQQQRAGGNNGGAAGMEQGQDPLEVLRQLLGMGGAQGGGEVEVLDPDSPLLQLYLQSLLPWAQVEGVRPPPRG